MVYDGTFSELFYIQKISLLRSCWILVQYLCSWVPICRNFLYIDYLNILIYISSCSKGSIPPNGSTTFLQATISQKYKTHSLIAQLSATTNSPQLSCIAYLLNFSVAEDLHLFGPLDGEYLNYQYSGESSQKNLWIFSWTHFDIFSTGYNQFWMLDGDPLLRVLRLVQQYYRPYQIYYSIYFIQIAVRQPTDYPQPYYQLILLGFKLCSRHFFSLNPNFCFIRQYGHQFSSVNSYLRTVTGFIGEVYVIYMYALLQIFIQFYCMYASISKILLLYIHLSIQSLYQFTDKIKDCLIIQCCGNTFSIINLFVYLVLFLVGTFFTVDMQFVGASFFGVLELGELLHQFQVDGETYLRHQVAMRYCGFYLNVYLGENESFGGRDGLYGYTIIIDYLQLLQGLLFLWISDILEQLHYFCCQLLIIHYQKYYVVIQQRIIQQRIIQQRIILDSLLPSQNLLIQTLFLKLLFLLFFAQFITFLSMQQFYIQILLSYICLIIHYC